MMLLLLLARLGLCAVFLVAGLAKLADLKGSQQAVRDFGMPAVLARPFGLLLPLAELAVAVALLLPATAWWGALGALVLLLLFVGGIRLWFCTHCSTNAECGAGMVCIISTCCNPPGICA